jgi:hypothetical protein
LIAAAFIVAAVSSIASANPTARVFGHPPPRPPAPTHRVTYADVLRAQAGGWRQVEAPAPFGANGAGTELLMTDGSVMVQDNTSNWYRLIPNVNGDYIEGRWRQAASLPAGYGPLYFGSAVLADGKLVIDGGEYNFFNPAETNQGAIYDPVADTWTSISPPGWSEVGDASSVVLADDTFMLGNCCNSSQALLNESTLTWTLTGRGKADGNSEEGWTLLPSGRVLTADVGNEPNSELYNPRNGSWSSAGPLPGDLTFAFEIGPQVLRPNGTVFAVGANGLTAIYQTGRHTWVAGPTLPTVNGQPLHDTDGPATLLTNGTVLLAASPGLYKPPMSMLLFNGRGLVQVAAPPNAPNDSSFDVRLLMLPTGQVLETDGSDDVEIYTPRVHPDLSTAPTITSVPSTLMHGSTYTIAGTLFNGVSQANAYGDDDQQATNYPLVRIQNSATGHVFYARTHDHSFMGVASMATVTTMFDVPAGIEVGASTIEVIANGVASAPVAVTVN